MARTRSLILVPILVFVLLLVAMAVVSFLRPQPAAPGLHRTSTSIWQLPEIHPEGVSPAPVAPGGAGAPGGKAPGNTTAPVSLPPELTLPAKGAQPQPPAAQDP